MKRLRETLETGRALLLCLSIMASAGRMSGQSADTLAGATVTGIITLSETGVRTTHVDSAALRENVSLALADILAYNSSVFIKQSGRATLSTISFRGTAASHTQVLWNDIKINSPMLGMTDFSLIPAYFIDKAVLLHGSASVGTASGGIGGAVVLETGTPVREGCSLQYIQGLGSFMTADEFIEFSCSSGKFSSVSRVLVSSSRNDFKYVNMDKKEVRYDNEMNIVESWHPVERNRNGAFLDFHAMQEFGLSAGNGNEFDLSVWYTGSDRELPGLTTDYGEDRNLLNEQREKSLRTSLRWRKTGEKSNFSVSAGHSFTNLGYDYARDPGTGEMIYVTKSRSTANSASLTGKAVFQITGKLRLKADISAYQHFIHSEDESKSAAGTAAGTSSGTVAGYRATRTEISASASLKWSPTRRLGLSATLREDCFGDKISKPVPALAADILVHEPLNLHLKGSVSGNYRFPTLNDLFFMPGGNPDLRPESGISCDIGYSAFFRRGGFEINSEGGWFDSYIKDWIMWLPAGAKKDFWSPSNVLKVHAYGLEERIGAKWKTGSDLEMTFNGNFTWSPSVDMSGKRNEDDEASGKQLPYIPEFSSSFSAGAGWKGWKFLWKWCWYSRRFTMSSNENTISGSVPPYFMNDITLGKDISMKRLDISVSLAVRNLFDEKYLSVLSRPMPGRNYELFLGITPRFGKKRN